MKRIITLIIIATLFTPLTFLSCKKKEEVIKIGALLPLTGDYASAGEDTKLGIDLAIEEINKSGGIKGKKISVLYEDSKGNPQIGVSAIHKLINIDHVQYVIDDSISDVTLAMSPIAETKKVLLLSTGATAPKISEAGSYIFRIWNSDEIECETLVHYCYKNLHLEKIAILYINNDYGLGWKDILLEKLKESAISISLIESFNLGEMDFRSQLSKLIKVSPEAIYLIGYPKDCSTILTQAKELGYKNLWLGTIVMAHPLINKAIQNTGYELYYVEPAFPNIKVPIVNEFINNFKRKYSKDAPILARVGYDSILLLREAINLSGGFNGEAIRSGLIKIKSFQGTSGIIEFDKYGDVHKPMKVRHLK